MSTAVSPCTKVCSIHPTVGLCIGCGRTLAEIGNWLRYSSAERKAIMGALSARREKLAAAAIEPILKQP